MEIAYFAYTELIKMSGQDSVSAIEGGTVGLTPPRSQCKTISLASSRMPVGGLFFRVTCFATALTKAMPLEGTVVLDFFWMMKFLIASTITLITESCLNV